MIILIIISIVCFGIGCSVIAKVERKRSIPNMYILLLNSKEKVNTNKGRIPQKIFYFFRRPYQEMDGVNIDSLDKNLVFKCITYEQLLDKVEEKECLLFGFRDLSKEGIGIASFWYKDGTFEEMDQKVVPEFIDAEENYCFACPVNEAPSSVRGECLTCPIQYKIEGRRSSSIKPDVKKYKKLNRD